MNTQSARMILNEKDHKDIYYNGKYHNQMWYINEYRKPILLWEKLNEATYRGFNISVKPESGFCRFKAKGDFTINWGDGVIEDIHMENLDYVHTISTHAYSTTSYNTYDVWLYGNIIDLDFSNSVGIKSFNNSLPPTMSWKTDFSYMFANIDGLADGYTITGDLFKYCVNATNFSSCFEDSNLLEIPKGLFDNCIAATNMNRCFYSGAFVNQITTIPDELFKNLSLVTDFSLCFHGRSAITTIGKDILANCTSAVDLGGFLLDTGIKEIPEGMLDDLVNLENVSSFCRSCESLETVPFSLFDNCPKLNNIKAAFYNDFSITSSVPPLWEREWTDTTQYEGCYYNCTGASNYGDMERWYWTEEVEEF